MVGFDAAAAAIAADAEPEWKPDPTWKVEFLFVSTPKQKWNKMILISYANEFNFIKFFYLVSHLK